MTLTPNGYLTLDHALLLGMAAWLGACVGSFSNVLIYRLPRNKDVVHGRSHCPSCQKHLAPCQLSARCHLG